MGQTTDDPFQSLVATARRLRGPRGCAWDRAQTTRSLLPHLVEESWEVFESARRGDRTAFRDELGDLLYTIVFLTLIAEDRGAFTLRHVLTGTRQKMIRRHPHVFGRRPAPTPRAAQGVDARRAAYASWQAAKRAERPRRRGATAKTLRPLLVDLWELLRRNPDAAARLRRHVRRAERTSGSSSRPSARRRPT